MTAKDRMKVLFQFTDIALQEYDRYLEMIEKHLDGEAESISTIFDSMEVENERGYSSIPQEYKDAVNDLSVELNLIAGTFTNHFRASFLIQIMSFIETELKKICEEHSRFSDSKYTISDLSGTDLEKCRKYLVKSANVNFNRLNIEWTFIVTIYKVRNRFVHHAGTISPEEAQKLNTLVEKRLLFISKNTEQLRIRIGRRLNEELLKNTRGFFTKLLTEELTISEEK